MRLPRVTAGGISRDPTRAPCMQSMPPASVRGAPSRLASPVQTRDLIQEGGYGLWEGARPEKEVEVTLVPATTHPYPMTNGTFLS